MQFADQHLGLKVVQLKVHAPEYGALANGRQSSTFPTGVAVRTVGAGAEIGGLFCGSGLACWVYRAMDASR
jgi:hypothetical protein